MQELTIIELLMKWLYDKKRQIFVLSICGVILVLITIVYGLPIVVMEYTGVLCSTVILLFAIVDYIQYWKRYKALLAVLQNSAYFLEKMPDTEQLSEKMYQKIIEEICSGKAEAGALLQERENSMNDYYTLWVHQIKTPIAAMKLILQSETNKQNQMIERELFRIEQYADMVLQYLRIRSSSTDLLLQEYPLYDMVKQVVKKYAGSFIGQKLSLDLQPFSGMILTDEKWFSICIEQILSNCIKYTEKGGISISFEETTQTLIIADTGIGIRSEDIPRIFECGFTGYNGRMDKKSTGIGLYLCKQIMDRLGYTIQVNSIVGTGTKFMLCLAREFLYEDVQKKDILQK